MRLAIRLFVARHRIGVGVVGFNNQNQVLLLRHVFHPKAPWGIPGGWLEKKESPAECALRELREETGISAVLGPIIQITRDDPPAHLSIYYEADIEQDPQKLSSEILDWGWFDPDELPGPMLPLIQRAIETAVGKRKESEL
jgi:ADP-ribose pyrophosphatase YjhB (NUDIX family)